MADFHIGLDFGTSQTKVCLYNKTIENREFLKFYNNHYFLPSIIVKKEDNTFSYGDENEKGKKYRYFKMSAAEDKELLQVTYENLDGHLHNNLDDYRKYSSDFDIKPEILVVLYLTYIYLYILQNKNNQISQKIGGRLGSLIRYKDSTENTFSINLGIPTEWNNPDHIKRKIKFQSLLLTAFELSKLFKNLNQFLLTNKDDLLHKISDINQQYLEQIVNKDVYQSTELVNNWLKTKRLSVFPESAAGINYLLKTKRLSNGAYATLDIGAGTSDIAIFEVRKNKLWQYYCSESVEIASNDFYREYAKLQYPHKVVDFDLIKEVENIIRKKQTINIDTYDFVKRHIKGNDACTGIEFAIRKTFYRNYFIHLFRNNKISAFNSKNKLNQSNIIVFGGGANLQGFCSGQYCFYKGSNPFGNHDTNFIAKPITDYVKQVDINDNSNDIQNYINLLILALGLTYNDQNGKYIPFSMPKDESPQQNLNESFDRYFYYDLQEAVYK
jgi:hypothetical protein